MGLTKRCSFVIGQNIINLPGIDICIIDSCTMTLHGDLWLVSHTLRDWSLVTGIGSAGGGGGIVLQKSSFTPTKRGAGGNSSMLKGIVSTCEL